MKNYKKILFSFFLLFFFCPFIVNAASASYNLSGTSEIRPGKITTLELNVKAPGLMAVQNENITSSNPSCLEITSITGLNGSTVNGKSFIFFLLGSTNDSKGLIKINLKAKSESCESRITVSGLTASIEDGNYEDANKSISKTVKVLAPVSTNNNLSSLTLSNGTLSFSKDKTSYSVNVASDVDKITITAKAEDSNSSVSGTGTKNLAYGSNKLNVTVTAEDGSKKTYTINVNREDNRSKNNYLEYLKVSSGELKFDKNKTSYNVNVASDIDKITIDARQEDSKASVKGTGKKSLSYGTNRFTITVTAENGSKKTYTVKVNREDNRSNNATLSSITINPGTIMDFSPTITDYDVEVSTDTEKLEVSAIATEKTAKVTIDNPTLQNDGPTDIKITVKAENGDTKTYVIHVTKKTNATSEEPVAAENTKKEAKLKNIVLTNGSLKNKFDANIYTYYYTKKDNFSYKYEVEDETIKVKTYEQEDSIYFVVENEEGDINIYCLHLYKTDIVKIVLIIIIILLLIVFGGMVFLNRTRNFNNNKVNIRKKFDKRS